MLKAATKVEKNDGARQKMVNSREMKWSKLLNPERARKSTVQKDHREEFERDFDRSIFSTPVKRLQDKAQVFPLDPCDAVRTRLTHSLEVSSVARGLAIKTGKWLLKKKEIKQGTERQIEAIAATSALIHDLGNPPFGHAGEDAIRSWFENHARTHGNGDSALDFYLTKFQNDHQRAQDLLRFEGNAQTLRLVTKLQILADFHGLNLTFGTLSASSKYIAKSHQIDRRGDKAKRKPGHFASENPIVERVQEATGTENTRNPITYLVEAADDIVYSVADIEDGIKKNVVTWKDVETALRSQKSGVPEKLKDILDRKSRILKAGRPKVPSGLPNDVHGSAFRTATIGVCSQDVFDTFCEKYEQIMEGSFQSDLASESDSSGIIEALKAFGAGRIYCTPSTLKLEMMGRKIINDLMTLFWEGAEKFPVTGEPKTKDFPGRIGALLSKNYRAVFQNAIKEEPSVPHAYHRYQLVTDYISGMTDSFACSLHRELFDAA